MIITNLADALEQLGNGQYLMECVSELSAIMGRKYDRLDLNVDENPEYPDIEVSWMLGNTEQEQVVLELTNDSRTCVRVEPGDDYPAAGVATTCSEKLFLEKLNTLKWAEVRFGT